MRSLLWPLSARRLGDWSNLLCAGWGAHLLRPALWYLILWPLLLQWWAASVSPLTCVTCIVCYSDYSKYWLGQYIFLSSLPTFFARLLLFESVCHCYNNNHSCLSAALHFYSAISYSLILPSSPKTQNVPFWVKSKKVLHKGNLKKFKKNIHS